MLTDNSRRLIVLGRSLRASWKGIIGLCATIALVFGTATAATGDCEPPGDAAEALSTSLTDLPIPRCGSWGEPQKMGKIHSDKLTEISGIAVSRRNPGVLWVHNDDGDAVIHALNRKGERIGSIELDDIDLEDWEDISVGPGPDGRPYIYVADTGDNDDDRNDISIIRFPEPLVDAETDPDDDFKVELEAEVFPFQYENGPADAEAMVVMPDGRPVIFTKREDGKATVHRLNTLENPDIEVHIAEKLGKLETADGREGTRAWATGADVTPDGRRLFIRTKRYAYQFDLDQNEWGLEKPKKLEGHRIPTHDEPQAEAIAYDPFLNGYWHVSEGRHEKLYFVPCASEENDDD